MEVNQFTECGMMRVMNTKIPPISEIKALLVAMTQSDLQGLSKLSGVPLTTLLKIRGGVTVNPGIETVRKFSAHLTKAAA